MNAAPEVVPVLASDFERLYVRPKAGFTVVVGSKIYKEREDRRFRYPPQAMGMDMQPGEGVDVVHDLQHPFPLWAGWCSHIDCISVLEHCKQPALLAANIETLLEPGGTLFVTVPFIWRVHAYPDDYWRFTTAAIRLLFPRIKWTKLCLAHRELSEDDKVPQVIVDGQIHFARCEVYGFGVLQCPN